MSRIHVTDMLCIDVQTPFKVGGNTTVTVDNSRFYNIGPLVAQRDAPAGPYGIDAATVVVGEGRDMATTAIINGILEIRRTVSAAKIAHNQRAPFIDLISIILAGAGAPRALFDKLAAKFTPDLTKAVTDICTLTAALAEDLETVQNDQERIEATLALIERNGALRDRVAAVAEAVAEPAALIETSHGARQSFREVVFANLALTVVAASGGVNDLHGVHQTGPGAKFTATGAGSDNRVTASEFHNGSGRVAVGHAHMRGVELNAPEAAVKISGNFKTGLMIGGNGEGAAMWIPGPGQPPRRR